MKTAWDQHLLTNADPELPRSQNTVKGEMVQSSVLGHMLVLDINLTAQGGVVEVYNDMIDCYDWIPLHLADLVTKRIGTKTKVAIFMINLIEGMVHHISVGSSISKDFLQRNEETYLDRTV